VRGDENARLRAQSGQFTLLKQKVTRMRTLEGETALGLYFRAHREPPLKKVTLLLTEAPVALKLCSLNGVTGAIMFPDYCGATRATKNEHAAAFWLR